MSYRIEQAICYLQENAITGWLVRDYQYSNVVLWELFGERVENLTRPVWLWIPASSQPKMICHTVDVKRFRSQKQMIKPYKNREEMLAELKGLFGEFDVDRPVVAMDYSANYNLPRVSRIDAGSLELIKGFDVDVISSENVMQFSLERWTQEQLESHRSAVSGLNRAIKDAFAFVGENIRWKLTEHDVAEFIRGRLDMFGIEYDGGPVVAFDKNTSDPHYEPRPESASIIRRDGWLLIDLWGRKKIVTGNQNLPISGDITWVAKIGSEPTRRQKQVFEVVRSARDTAFKYLESTVLSGRYPEGWEIDQVARDVIIESGYGEYFIHRLGHSLGHRVHSNGVNLDNWESHDTRQVIPGIGVTIEPGIYLPDFGVRLEMDVFINEDGPEITVEKQEEIFLIET